MESSKYSRLTLHPIATNSELQAVVTDIAPNLPTTFRTQAALAASFVDQLDAGKAEDPRITTFLSQIATASFVKDAYANSSSAAYPTSRLPAWLQRDYLIGHGLLPSPDQKLTEDERIQTKRLFNRWVRTEQIPFEREWEGHYYRLPTVDKPTITPDNSFKVYLEDRDLLAALSQQKISDLISQQHSLGLRLHSLKLLSAHRLMFYYSGDVEQVNDQLRQSFCQSGLRYRGPAQDTWKVIVNKNEGLDLRPIESNDRGLRISRHEMTQPHEINYLPKNFLTDYLNSCAEYGKSPDKPFQISFLHLIRSFEAEQSGVTFDKARREQFLEKARALVRYPVM